MNPDNGELYHLSVKKIDRSGFCSGVPACIECEVEGSTPAGDGIGPDLSLVAVNGPLNSGQTDPRARELGWFVQPLKGDEQRRGVAPVETGSIVLDEEDPPAIQLFFSDLDYCPAA